MSKMDPAIRYDSNKFTESVKEAETNPSANKALKYDKVYFVFTLHYFITNLVSEIGSNLLSWERSVNFIILLVRNSIVLHRSSLDNELCGQLDKNRRHLIS